MSVVTLKNFAVLGINGVDSFFEQFGGTDKSLDAVQFINDDFIEKVERMRTYPFGFTHGFKIDFVDMLKDSINSFCLVLDEWVIENQTERMKFLKAICVYLNEGKTFDEAVRQAQNENDLQVNKLKSIKWQ